MKELPEGSDRKTNLELEEIATQFSDLRSVEGSATFSLQHNGFTLQRLQNPEEVQWDVAEQVGTFAHDTCTKCVSPPSSWLPKASPQPYEAAMMTWLCL